MLVLRKKNAARQPSPASRPPQGQIRVSRKLRPARYFRYKEFVERIVAAALLLPGLPLIGVLALLVRLQSRGPGLYRQARLGKNGRLFMMYKIRTMRADAEDDSGPVWAAKNDPRITRLGRILRKLHLDELPQLFNVVKGEMALIGPRPERPELVCVLAGEISNYTNRLVVRPGVSGMAQINLPPDATLDDVRRKLVLDLEYIEQAGPWLDARILLCSALRLLGLPGAAAMRVCRLRRSVPRIVGPPATMRVAGSGDSAAKSDGGRSERAPAAAHGPDHEHKKLRAAPHLPPGLPNHPR